MDLPSIYNGWYFTCKFLCLKVLLSDTFDVCFYYTLRCVSLKIFGIWTRILLAWYIVSPNVHLCTTSNDLVVLGDFVGFMGMYYLNPDSGLFIMQKFLLGVCTYLYGGSPVMRILRACLNYRSSWVVTLSLHLVVGYFTLFYVLLPTLYLRVFVCQACSWSWLFPSWRGVFIGETPLLFSPCRPLLLVISILSLEIGSYIKHRHNQ